MIPGIKIDLGGTVMTVPPLSLGSLEVLQERLGKFTGGIEPESIAVVIDATHMALLRNYPDIQREAVADLIGLENMGSVMQAVMDVSGIRRKALEAGESKAPETTS